MRFGIIGLGRIGSNLALQAIDKSHEVVVFNRSPERTREAAKEGAEAAFASFSAAMRGAQLIV